jgi:hypothetical protein
MGVKIDPIFEHSRYPLTNAPEMGYNRVVNFAPTPLPQGGEGKLVRVHRLSSLCARCARFFALTPSPSPTGWERGVEANGGSPNDRFPPRPLAGEGGKGGEGQKGALAPEISYLTPVPLSGEGKGVGRCNKQESSARRRKHKIGEAEANSPHPNPLPPSSRGEREEGSGGINTKTGGDARWRG